VAHSMNSPRTPQHDPNTVVIGYEQGSTISVFIVGSKRRVAHLESDLTSRG